MPLQLTKSKERVIMEMSREQLSASMDPRLDSIKRLKEQAFALVDSAISLETEFVTGTSSIEGMDELMNIRMAKEFYRRGMVKMGEMTKMVLPTHEPSKEEARAMKEKSKQTMDMIKERLRLLQRREEDL